MNSNNCCVCLNEKARVVGDDGGGPKIDCPRCGKFKIGWITENFLGNITQRQRANLSGWIRQNSNCVITQQNIKELLAMPTPSTQEKVERLFLHLTKIYPEAGEIIELSEDVSLELQVVSWALDQKELLFLMNDYLQKEMDFLSVSVADKCYKISPKGWDYFDSRRQEMPRREIGFHVVQ